jgi:hypothetical protein
MDKYRFDYVFTYWFFIAYVLYMCKLNPYNPKPVLYFGISFLIVQVATFLMTNVPLSRIAFFLFYNLFLKFIPLYTISHTKLTWRDTQFYIGMFVVYIMWLIVNEVNLKDFFMSYLSPNLANTDAVKNKSYTPLNNTLNALFPDTF